VTSITVPCHIVNGAEDRQTKGYDPDAALNYYKFYFEKER